MQLSVGVRHREKVLAFLGVFLVFFFQKKQGKEDQGVVHLDIWHGIATKVLAAISQCEFCGQIVPLRSETKCSDLQIVRFGVIAICDSNHESQITSDLKGSVL